MQGVYGVCVGCVGHVYMQGVCRVYVVYVWVCVGCV